MPSKQWAASHLTTGKIQSIEIETSYNASCQLPAPQSFSRVFNTNSNQNSLTFEVRTVWHKCCFQWKRLNISERASQSEETMCTVFQRETALRSTHWPAAGELDHWGECIRLVKSHSYSVRPALTPVLFNSCGWQRCAPSLSGVRGIKTALLPSLYTRMRWKIMILLQKVNNSDVNENKRKSQLL